METQELAVNIEQQEAIDEANHLAGLKEILKQKMSDGDRFATHGKVVDFLRGLKNEGIETSTLKNYKIYHLLIGSTVDGTQTGLDLPDGRLEKFIREEL